MPALRRSQAESGKVSHLSLRHPCVPREPGKAPWVGPSSGLSPVPATDSGEPAGLPSVPGSGHRHPQPHVTTGSPAPPGSRAQGFGSPPPCPAGSPSSRGPCSQPAAGPGHGPRPARADTTLRKAPTGEGRVSTEPESEVGSRAEVRKGNRGKKVKAGKELGQNAPESKRENRTERQQAPQAEAEGGEGQVGPRRENRGEPCSSCPPGLLSRATCGWGLEGSAWGYGWARIPFQAQQHQFSALGGGLETQGVLVQLRCPPTRSIQAQERGDAGKTGSGRGALVFPGEAAAWDLETGENT